jgi:hypothetical protein
MLEYVVGDLKITVLILFGATGILCSSPASSRTCCLRRRPAQEVALREAIGAGRRESCINSSRGVVLVTIEVLA